MIDIPTGYFVAALGGSVIGSGVVALILMKLLDVKFTKISGSRKSLADYEREEGERKELRGEYVEKLKDLREKLYNIIGGLPDCTHELEDFGRELYNGKIDFNLYRSVIDGVYLQASHLGGSKAKKLEGMVKELRGIVRGYLGASEAEL